MSNIGGTASTGMLLNGNKGSDNITLGATPVLSTAVTATTPSALLLLMQTPQAPLGNHWNWRLPVWRPG